MGQVVFGYAAGDSVTFWTEGQSHPATSNLILHGRAIVALHDTDQFTPGIRTLLQGVPDSPSEIARWLMQQLQALWPAGNAPGFGVIIGGVQGGRGSIFGLHSKRNFMGKVFSPGVVGGLPPVIFDYLRAQLAGVIASPQDALDFLTLCAELYGAVYPQFPKLATVCVADGQSPTAYLPQAELDESRSRVDGRLRRFQRIVVDLVLKEPA